MEGHKTEVVKDNVSQAGGWQESLRDPSPVPVPPSKGSSSQEGGDMGQDVPVGAGLNAQWRDLDEILTWV